MAIVDSVSVLTYTLEEVKAASDAVISYVLKTYENGIQIGGDTEHDNADRVRQVEIDYIAQGFRRVLSHQQKLQLVTEWNNADQQQKFWRERELSYRASIVAEMYTLENGTQRVDLESGWQLKIERGLEYKLDNKTGEVDKAMESELIPKAIQDLLINWKPEMVRKVYDTLTDEQKTLFDNCLTIKNSSPQVELVPPKAAKG